MADLSTPDVVQSFGGRLFVHLADIDGDTVHAHGLVACPPHLRNRDQALAEIDRIFGEVVQADPEEWNYDDVIARLEGAGFEHFCPAYWLENHAAADDV